MLNDLIAAVRAGVREFHRRRWVKRRIRNLQLPF
jgi:hypothetical protein